ncbi:MAG TPA: hypothetical protein VK742_06920 [Candidatus Sulfotelmatobacter sp.]|nr:hypothetical protein [Candidatus Sulfotelmatobacter sp.]
MDGAKLLLEVTGDVRLVQWLCAQMDGFFVPNAVASRANKAASRANKISPAKPDLARSEHALWHDIGAFEVALTEAVEKPAASSRAEQVRSCWEVLKAGADVGARKIPAFSGVKLHIVFYLQRGDAGRVDLSELIQGREAGRVHRSRISHRVIAIAPRN